MNSFPLKPFSPVFNASSPLISTHSQPSLLCLGSDPPSPFSAASAHPFPACISQPRMRALPSAFDHDLKRDTEQPSLACTSLHLFLLLHTPSSPENYLHCLTPFPYLLLTPQPTPIWFPHTSFSSNALCHVTSTSFHGADPFLSFQWWLCVVLATLPRCHVATLPRCCPGIYRATLPWLLPRIWRPFHVLTLILLHPTPESWDSQAWF